MNLFTTQIDNWQDWSKVFQNMKAWYPLIIHIFEKERLSFSKVELLTPGTNAVFKVDNFVIKIFAPIEAGMEVGTNYDTELFGIKRANDLSIPAPRLISKGVVDDKYRFRYMIMEFIYAPSLGKIEQKLTFDEKVTIGRKLRGITDRLNTPCENFNPVDVIENSVNNHGWCDYPNSFNTERLAYLANMQINKKVYCHGDLNPDNIFVDDNLDLYIIDFADAMYAPAEYEQALIACELFCFEKSYMIGYFGKYIVDDIVDLCSKWLPVHDSGEYTLRCNIGPSSEITSFKIMRDRLYGLIKSEKEKTINVDIISHYNLLIDENNDPARDPEPLKAYMDKWDGEQFIKELQLTPDKSVLEIGVGTGRLAIQICGNCANFTGIDISPKTVERANENLGNFQNINLICDDFLKYRFNESFDVVYSSLTFMHIKDKQIAVQKVANLLTSGGIFVLSIDKNRQTEIDFGSRTVTVYPDTPEEIELLLSGAGLFIKKQFETELAVVFVARKDDNIC